MSNALVDLTFKLDVPEERLERLVGRADDGSQEWHGEAWQKLEDAVADDPSDYLNYVTTEPDVEVTM